MEKVRLVFEIPKDLHHKLKVKTVTEGTTMSAVLLKCAERYVERQPDRTTEERAKYGEE